MIRFLNDFACPLPIWPVADTDGNITVVLNPSLYAGMDAEERTAQLNQAFEEVPDLPRVAAPRGLRSVG